MCPRGGPRLILFGGALFWDETPLTCCTDFCPIKVSLGGIAMDVDSASDVGFFCVPVVRFLDLRIFVLVITFNVPDVVALDVAVMLESADEFVAVTFVAAVTPQIIIVKITIKIGR